MLEQYEFEGTIFNVHPSQKEDFLKKYPNAQLKQDESGKTSDPVNVEANAGSNNMASNLENISLDFLKEQDKKNKIEKEQALKFEIAKRKEITDKRAETNVGKMINSLDNVVLRLRGFDDRLTVASSAIYRKIFGDEAVDNFVNNPNIDDFWKIGLSDNDVKKANEEINRLEQLQGKTGEIIKEGGLSDIKNIKFSSGGELVAGIFNAITSFGSSAVIGASTGGAGIITDFFAESYIRMNEERAGDLGIDPIDLMNSEEAEFYKPLLLGTAAGLLEKIGIKGVSKSIGKIKTGAVRKTTARLWAGSTEATTEYTQGILEAIESPLVKRNYDNVGEAAWDYMASKEGLESLLQGFVGGAGISTGATATPKEAAAAGAVAASALSSNYIGLVFGAMTPMSAKNAASEFRSPQEIEQIDKLLQEINNLQEQKLKVKDKEIKADINESITDKRKQIAEITSKSNEQINNIAEADLQEINSIKGLAQKFNSQIANLNKKLRVDKTITLDEFNIASANLLEKFQNTKKELSNKLSSVSLKNQNIAKKNEELINIVKTSTNESAIEKAKSDLYTNNLGFINKLINSAYNPNLDTELTKEDFTQGVNEQFVKLINTYKFKSPFGAYVQKNLPRRLPAIFDALVKTTPEGEIVGTTDITQIRESKIDLDDTTQEALDFVRTEPKAKEQLRDVAGITKESVQTEAKQILKGKLPGIIEKSGRDKNEILTAINKASQLKIADNVLEEMGGNFSNKEEQNSRFITFMDVNFDAVIKAIPNSVKNKLPLFEAKQVDRESMQEGDAAGKGVFEYKNPTRDEFVKYYTEGGLTTLRAKKKKLADILAQEIGKDAIAEVLADPNIQKDFLERQELLGKEIPKAPIPKLLQRIDRVIKILEKPIVQPGTLQSSIGVNIAEEVRRIALKILKIFRKALSEGLSFKKARKQALDEVRKEKLLPKDVQKAFDETLSAGIASENDVNPKNILKTTAKAKRNEMVAAINYGISLDTKYLKNVIDDKNLTDEVKTQILFNFFIGHSQVYQKTDKKGKIINWKEQSASKVFAYWLKELGPKLKKLGFSGDGRDIRYKNKKIFAPTLRPSLVNSKFKDEFWIKSGDEKIFNNRKAAEFYKRSGELYKNNIEELDAQSDFYIDNIINTSERILQTEGKKAMANYIHLMNDYSDSPLRLVGKVRKYEISNKSRGPHVYDHNPPIKVLIEKLDSVIKSTDDAQEILTKLRKILEESEVNLITKETDNKLTELGRRSSGEKKTRLIGAVDPKNLIEIKRPKQEIKEETDKVDLNKDFNDILEQKTGIASEERYTKAKAEIKGKGKGAFDYIGIPPSAQDFMGLLYKTLAGGKLGNSQLAWYKKNLLDPFAKAMIDVSNYRVTLSSNYKGIKKEGNITSEILQKKLPDGFFTTEQAIRVYIWNKQGIEIEGLEKDSSDLKQLVKYVKKDPKLATFANRLILINKKNKYPEPDKNWLVGTITTDLLKSINTNVRKDALSQWKSNVDIIFSKDNMNKLEAAFGKKYRSALDNMLKRMESGRNRGYPGDQLTGRFVDWLNGSVGTIMFFNMRSAVLQTISSINFINFTDNNPLKAAAAFANQPQYWKDVMFIMNSDFLVERRNGLKINVNEADIAEIAAESDNKAKAFVNKLLKLGFLPTQIADSFAIATGGATFYRNRVKSYIKNGLSEKEAQEKAFIDFREITEENQQSSRPDRISQQQAGPLGRLILAFANTPAQYARIIQKAASDLKNGRGDAKTNISQIIYYGAIQNVIFNAMQKALFAIAFGDEEPDDEKEAEKYGEIVNGMADSLLRGAGFAGAAVSTVKNMILRIAQGDKAKDAAEELLKFSPPISSKIGKFRSAGRTFDWNKKEIAKKGLSLDNPAYMAIGQYVSAITNVPLDRGVRKLTNIKDALDSENEEWMRIANALGWPKWELEWEQDKRKKKKKTKVKNKLSTRSSLGGPSKL